MSHGKWMQETKQKLVKEQKEKFLYGLILKHEVRRTNHGYQKKIRSLGWSLQEPITIGHHQNCHVCYGQMKKIQFVPIGWGQIHSMTGWTALSPSPTSTYSKTSWRQCHGVGLDWTFKLVTISPFEGCFSWDAIGSLVRIVGTMVATDYGQMMATHVLSHAQPIIPSNWLYQQNRTWKHHAHLMFGNERNGITGWFKDNNHLIDRFFGAESTLQSCRTFLVQTWASFDGQEVLKWGPIVCGTQSRSPQFG